MQENIFDGLVCPKCHSKLTYDEKVHGLICSVDKLMYPIVEDIPVLLADEAQPFL